MAVQVKKNTEARRNTNRIDENEDTFCVARRLDTIAAANMP
jgi:hypothetical protein